MKEKVPFTTHTVAGLDKPLEVYDYLTYDEENEHLKLLLGDQELDAGAGEAVANITVTAEKAVALKDFRFKTLARNLDKIDFNVLPPKVRAEVESILEGVLKKKGA